MKHQTTAQILRCFTLGSYTATVECGELKVRGPQPLAGPLPASIRANRDDLIKFLGEWCGGVWPPAPGSEFRNIQQVMDCGASAVLAGFERLQKRGAA